MEHRTSCGDGCTRVRLHNLLYGNELYLEFESGELVEWTYYPRPFDRNEFLGFCAALDERGWRPVGGSVENMLRSAAVLKGGHYRFSWAKHDATFSVTLMWGQGLPYGVDPFVHALTQVSVHLEP